MRLVLTIIQDADASTLMRVLADRSFDVTKLASTGGFLREGNITLMIGVSEHQVQDLKTIIQQTCHTRTRLVSPRGTLDEQSGGTIAEPVEVSVGGAILFVLSVEEFVKV